ncbi:MAG TPA: O-antigen ligase family protein [Thermoanaerobaculia bacterium]|nr:O-antigen ligase family protein [Thermoanaerobaculia bacterium]
MLSLCQYLNIWRPFTIVYENHDVTHLEGKLSMSGFVGSPNDVGMIVVLPAIATIALTAVTRGATRVAAGTVSAILLAALFASQSVTAIGAFVVAAASMLFVAFPRRTGVAAVGAVAVLLAALFGYAPLRQRFTAIAELMRAGEYNHMLAGRLQPYMAAAFMFRDHPLFGAGPGTFHWHYMPYRVEIGHRFPERFVMAGPAIQNFGQAHNDHLQVLAETGLPGYLLFGAALVMLARFSLRVRAPDGSSAVALSRARFVRLFALPFAAGLATLALAQFPLQVAAPRIVYLFLAALIVAWGGADA